MIILSYDYPTKLLNDIYQVNIMTLQCMYGIDQGCNVLFLYGSVVAIYSAFWNWEIGKLGNLLLRDSAY